ncbi:transporter substrate-binding domain-containing protein [Martelella lutilitoris]|uniref:Transporter substrate-binding domain-containing protein n=1 Tax=Martelella lutilitoris TaxID=2583532 RepID=A0A7T7KLR1_9HYPH|nr:MULTISPECIES: transporter substrate-binding domain-containing protein [Martelella]AMM83108.1 amino acid ABC transporter [Martelella sp. AD-3]QQM31011.1 transporter substrate-binding domain-containing protein [Martelella lutilitoris]
MKKLTSALLGAAACLALSAGAASAETVKVGVAAEPYPPFTVPDAAGNWTGWEIDLMDALCKEAALDCVITPIAWDGIIPALTAGKIDAIMASMSITPEREEQIAFSDKYYSTPGAIVAEAGSGIEPTNESLSGKVLGVQVSTTNQDYAEKHFPDAEIKTYQTQDEVNQDLYAGRIDAEIADLVTLQPFLESDNGKACCEMMGTVAQDVEIYGPGIGVGLRKDDTELREKFNAAIAAVRADGTYEEITKKYFDFDIYGD